MGSEKPSIDTRDTALLKGSQGFIKHAESSQSREKSDQLTVLGYQQIGSLKAGKTARREDWIGRSTAFEERLAGARLEAKAKKRERQRSQPARGG